MQQRTVTRHHPLTPWLIVFVFLAPIFMAYFLYAKRETITFKTTQSGTFFTPSLSAESFPFYDKTWLGKWQIVYVTPSLLPTLTQIQKALGKDEHRVAIQSLLATSLPASLALILNTNTIMVIDPRGFLTLHYPTDIPPDKLLKDMKRLLRYSHG